MEIEERMGDGMSAVLVLVAVLFALTSWSDASLAEKRVALVIGNSAYKHAGELANPKNDATDVAAALNKLDFKVIEGFDLDKASLDRMIRDFASALQGADVGLFFYAGHGLQVAGQNYLVPVDAELTTAAALDFEMVRLDLLHRTMEREAPTNILFLDACRNNPLVRNLARALGTRSADVGYGLARVESGSGTLISFSTQPGNVASDGSGRNSPFTGPLVKHITSSNEDLGAVLIAVRNDVMSATQGKQVPWENSALLKRIYLTQAQLHEVCYGEVEAKCRRFPNIKWQSCNESSFTNDVCLKYCKRPVGDGSCSVERRQGTKAEDGGACGYSWVDVRCK